MQMTFKLYKTFLKQAYLEFLIAYIASIIIVGYANIVDKHGGGEISAVILVVAIMLVFVALHVKFILQWFHKDFFSKSAYITFMIPASFNTLILSRILALLTFYIISMVVIFIEYKLSFGHGVLELSENGWQFAKSSFKYFFEVATFCFLMIAFRGRRFKMMYCIGVFALIYIIISIGQFPILFWNINGSEGSFGGWREYLIYVFNIYVVTVILYIVAFFRLKTYEL
ncbi:hypothetical protein BKH43_00735 [Helicobacter sp. 13S00401-1]|uniref:hypothetical protein n=1 Tax=Helicobacter sp. 13S00401-1 TaxID=1905758 RepID=UPI000BA62DF8|nr:hypothetical protein [Helicobacter sp. 13S00401-1]PAF51794.1 hypothetical protein BKH43_00735 [Helicobacter sp. 13S00401-1]